MIRRSIILWIITLSERRMTTPLGHSDGHFFSMQIIWVTIASSRSEPLTRCYVANRVLWVLYHYKVLIRGTEVFTGSCERLLILALGRIAVRQCHYSSCSAYGLVLEVWRSWTHTGLSFFARKLMEWWLISEFFITHIASTTSFTNLRSASLRPRASSTQPPVLDNEVIVLVLHLSQSFHESSFFSCILFVCRTLVADNTWSRNVAPP